MGVLRYHNGNWNTYNEDSGMLDNEVIEMFEDRKSNVWVVTKKGLSIISSQ
jgi:ligand-binding sensor domain-containing protein